MTFIIETARALVATFFFIVVMPVLAFGGFLLAMHGVNEGSEVVCNIGLACIPFGWIALYVALKSDFLI